MKEPPGCKGRALVNC